MRNRHSDIFQHTLKENREDAKAKAKAYSEKEN